MIKCRLVRDWAGQAEGCPQKELKPLNESSDETKIKQLRQACCLALFCFLDQRSRLQDITSVHHVPEKDTKWVKTR